MACIVQPSGGHPSEGFCTELFNFVNYLIAHNSRFYCTFFLLLVLYLYSCHRTTEGHFHTVGVELICKLKVKVKTFIITEEY